MTSVDAERLNSDGGGRRLEPVTVEVRQPVAASRHVGKEEPDLTTGGSNATDNPTATRSKLGQFKPR